MAVVNFLAAYQSKTPRDYLARVTADDKAACAAVAGQWGRDYWDGDRKFGYGGYRYDGRWRAVAQDIVAHYGLKPGMRILDVGCGKGFLLYEISQLVPGIEVAGIDISDYGIANAKEEVHPFLRAGNATELPFPDRHFDFVLSLNTLHNLRNFELKAAVTEINRVSRGKSYICVESFRNEREKVNLLYWQLTCRTFLATDEWEWLMGEHGYAGDLGFIFFE